MIIPASKICDMDCFKECSEWAGILQNTGNASTQEAGALGSLKIEASLSITWTSSQQMTQKQCIDQSFARNKF